MTSSIDSFIRVANRTDIPASGRLVVEAENRMLVLVQLDDEIYCIDDICTHDGGTLGDGELEGHCLVCPRHGAKFDVRSGEAMTMPATEPTASHEVKIVGDDIWIKIHELP